MHELFTQVLSKKDLSKAGDLFGVSDKEIVNDLTEVIKKISEIASLSDYANNDNDQSVVEICITRVTSAIRETGSVEQHAEALVSLLESCLNHNLKPSNKDEDPPHAKISSDIISCIFLNYSKRSVMKRALPVAVKFLHKGNRELSRNMASYLSLAAIGYPDLLANHIQLIMDSIFSGNYSLCRVLPQVYESSKDSLQDHGMALASLLPLCDSAERLSLLQLFTLFAHDKPNLLEPCLPQLTEYLGDSATAGPTLQVLLELAEKKPQLLFDWMGKVKQAASDYPSTLCTVAKVVSTVGKLSKERAQEALNFVLEQLGKAERGSQGTLLKEASLLCSSYPALFTDNMLHTVRSTRSNVGGDSVNGNSGVTIVKVEQGTGSSGVSHYQTNKRNSTIGPISRSAGQTEVKSGRSSRAGTGGLGGGDSKSTSRLHSTAAHRSMTRLNQGSSGSVGLHKSMTRLAATSSVTNITGTGRGGKVSCSGVTVTTNNIGNSSGVSPTPTISAWREEKESNLPMLPILSNHHSVVHPVKQSHSPLMMSSPLQFNLSSHHPFSTGGSSGPSSLVNSVSTPPPPPPPAAPSPGPPSSVVVPRRSNTSVTIINHNSDNAAIVAASQRISVFEPYPMRDTVQHFCEKHLNKIKAYMEQISEVIPLPVKCTIEERRAKKMAKLQFACDGRGEHCLYRKTLFTMRSRNPRIWVHLMFLALQAKSDSALSSRHSHVTALKHCWDILKCENKPFVTLVTSAFPCAKDREAILNEVGGSGFRDVFESMGIKGGGWACFLCNHPERAVPFLRDQPLIEGQLKEKKGRWRMFRRWRTRYFTLSGARLEYKGTKDDKEATPIDVNQIRSVKVSRGARNIPKAFEIFTQDHSLILKPKGGKNVEEWVQCLSVVVAQSQAKEVPPSSGRMRPSSIHPV